MIPRQNVLKFNLPSFQSRTKLIVRRAEGFHGVFDFFKVYDPYIWLMIMCVFVAFGFIGKMVHTAEWKLGLRDRIGAGEVKTYLFVVNTYKCKYKTFRVLNFGSGKLTYNEFNRTGGDGNYESQILKK
jgi:hypothetical protein